MSDPCDNDLVKRVNSPAGELVVSVYSRQCPSRLYTYLAIEEPASFLSRRGEVVCHLVSWGGKHPVSVEWKDAGNILVSTSDELSDLDLGDAPKEACGKIAIEYSIPGYPRPADPEPTLESVPDMTRLVLEDLGPCIDAFARKGDPSRDIVADIERYAKKGPQSLAVGTIIRFSDAAKCDMSDITRSRLTRLAELYKQKPPGSNPPDTLIFRPTRP